MAADVIERRRDKDLHRHRPAELGAHNAVLAWYLGEYLREFQLVPKPR